MSSMRIRQLAKECDIPHRDLLARIKRDLPSIPVDSVMSYVTDDDIALIVQTLATEEPRYTFKGTSYAKMAKEAAAEYDRQRKRAEQRAKYEQEAAQRAAEAEANRKPQFGERSLSPDVQWQAFKDVLGEIKRAEKHAYPTPDREVLSLERVTVYAAAQEGVWIQTMSRRRAALGLIGFEYRRFSWDLLEDVRLLRLDADTHHGLWHAEPDAVQCAQDIIGIFYDGCEIDWDYADRYILRYIDEDDAEIKTGLSREDVRRDLTCDDRLHGELMTALGFEELTQEQLDRIKPWLRGEGDVDYEWLRSVIDDDAFVFSAALSFEQRRAERAMIQQCLEHVFGEGEHATYIKLNNENENTRYRFSLYVGQGGIASSIVSFEL